jgi:hypothetical protein
MTTVWERVALVPRESLAAIAEGEVAHHAGVHYAELPESGWGALVGWLAGSERLLGHAETSSDHQTVLTVEREGSTTVQESVRNAAEQATVDEDINGFLLDAGAEPRPTGVRWFVQLPAGVTAQDFWSLANDAAAKSGPHPSELKIPLQRALARLYGG